MATSQVSPLESLALRLAANHLDESGLPHSRWTELSPSGEVLKKFDRHRVIVVVGAGASTTAALPDAKHAIEKIRQRLAVDQSSNDEFKAEMQRLEKVWGQDPSRFETALQAFSLTWWGDRKVREVLAEMYRKRHVPLLPYEIIAHLLKHRFVHAVINFNFDEELDQSIADELNDDEYVRIVSDGDWPADADIRNTRLYIKPHGSVSAPSTLRFTREAYWGTPAGISVPLNRLIHNEPVVVVTVGFSLSSFEFNGLLDGAAPTSELYCIDIHNPVPNPPLRRLEPNTVLIPDGKTLGDVLVDVWECVRHQVLPNLPMRSIARHQLITRLFEDRSTVFDQDNSRYLHDRTLVEICLSFAKSKGLINLSELIHDRAGIYFGKYVATHDNVSLVELCKRLELRPIGYGNETITHFATGANPPRIIPATSAATSEPRFETIRDQLIDALEASVSPPTRRALENHRLLVEQTMDGLYHSAEVEVRAERSLETRAFFRKVRRHLDNSTSLWWYTKSLLATDCRMLLVVAETGEWLLKSEFADLLDERRSQICLIVADRSKEAELVARFGPRILIRDMDWWDHNRHMTIVMQDRRARGSIYFARRMRSASISPVLLDAEDSVAVLEIFIAYWIKSKSVRGPDRWVSAERAQDKDAFLTELRAEFEKAASA